MDVSALRLSGNKAFQSGRFADAVEQYTRAIDLWMEPSDRAALYTNRAAARLKLGENEKALSDAQRATSLAPTYAKAYFRAAAALRALNRPVDAAISLRRTLELAPGDAAAKQALTDLQAQKPAEAVMQAATTRTATSSGMRDHDIAMSMNAVASTPAPSAAKLKPMPTTTTTLRPSPAASVPSITAAGSAPATRGKEPNVVWSVRDHDDPTKSRIVALTPAQAAAEEADRTARLIGQVRPGTRVVLACLQARAELNGKYGRVVGPPRDDGRLPVQIEDDKKTRMWMQRHNIDPASEGETTSAKWEPTPAAPPRMAESGRGYAFRPPTTLPPPARYADDLSGAAPLPTPPPMTGDVACTSAAGLRVVEIAARGRGIIASNALPAGTLLSELGGPPLGACVLPSRRLTRCARCFAELRSARARPDELLTQPFPLSGSLHVRMPCAKCAFAHYCSAACAEADAPQHARQCKHLAEGGALRALEGSSQIGAVGRLGAVLLAGRCLWRRHDEGVAMGAALGATGGGRGQHDPLKPTARADAALFDSLLPGPNSDADAALGQLAEGLAGFLPPGAAAENITALLGSFRVNQLLLTAGHTASPLGIGCYPRAALLNHSCAPNCVLVFDGACVRVRTICNVAEGEELLVSYVDLLRPTTARQMVLRYGYGFECVCTRCTGFAPLDAAIEDMAPVPAEATRCAALDAARALLERADAVESGEDDGGAAEATDDPAADALALTRTAVERLRDAGCDNRSAARYEAEVALLTRIEEAGNEPALARDSSANALEHVAACLAHVPRYPRLSLEQYRHAQIEAECGDEESALRLADLAAASLRVSHGKEHDLTAEVEAWAEDLRVQCELEADLTAQSIFREPADEITGGGGAGAKLLEEPPPGPEPLHAF